MPGYQMFTLPDAYRRLLDLDAPGFAWEWLRRDPAFRSLWSNAGDHVHRFAARTAAASRRGVPVRTRFARHPLAAALEPWGLDFSPSPDVPADERPLIGWLPALRVHTLTLVRPAPWARAIDGLRFDPTAWPVQSYELGAPGGMHLVLRRQGAPELSIWLPRGRAPRSGGPCGLLVHPDRHLIDRVGAARTLRNLLGAGRGVPRAAYRDAGRQVVALCLYDRTQEGKALPEVVADLLGALPSDWRSSSIRSDLRRLVQMGRFMVSGGYRLFLRPERRSAEGADDPFSRALPIPDDREGESRGGSA